MTVNKAILVGNLGQDPELRTTTSGTAIVNLRLATTDRRKDREGNWTDHTEWHTVVAFGRQAENVNRFCKKGKQIFVEGRIQTRKWQDRDGRDRYSTEVVADNIRFLGGGGGGGGGEGSYGGGGGGGGAALVEKPAPEKAADDEVARLKREVETLKKNQKQPAPGADEEKAAAALLQKMTQAVKANQIDAAKAMLSSLRTNYPSTNAYKRARRYEGELAVIGKDAPAYLNVDRWLANPASIDLTSTSPTLLVFWEEWCPHCKREVPKIQDVYQRYGRRGLQVVGLTKMTRSSTPEKVDDFIRENRLRYPIAKEKDGTISKYFNVKGIPAAAVVKDGKIVWRGHPGRLTDTMFESWL